jgi:hypothetical protein
VEEINLNTEIHSFSIENKKTKKKKSTTEMKEKREGEKREESNYCVSPSSSSCNTSCSAFELTVIKAGVAASRAKGDAGRSWRNARCSSGKGR